MSSPVVCLPAAPAHTHGTDVLVMARGSRAGEFYGHQTLPRVNLMLLKRGLSYITSEFRQGATAPRMKVHGRRCAFLEYADTSATRCAALQPPCLLQYQRPFSFSWAFSPISQVLLDVKGLKELELSRIIFYIDD